MRVAGRGVVLGSALLQLCCGFSAAGGGAGGTATDDDGASTQAGSDDVAPVESTTDAGGGTGSTGAPPSTSGTSTGPDPVGTTALDGSSSSAADSTTETMEPCTTVLLVSGDGLLDGLDAAIVGRLQGLGLEVKVVDDDVAAASDADGMCLVVVSSTGLSTNLTGEFRDVAVPLVTWESALYPDLRMVAANDVLAFGVMEVQSDIAIVDAAHPMAAGLALLVAIYDGVGRVSWGIPQGQAQIVATLPLDPFRATIFGFEAGATMADGFVAPARRVGHCAATTTTPYSQPGFALFDAAIAWALTSSG
jgi:hypothetical protein